MKLTVASFKKACNLTPKEIAHWPCQERYDVIRRNADECFKMEQITEKTRDALYRYATQQLMK
ncbi:hypothetical protein VPHD479_0075 [Vibrio phage D479]